MTFEFFPRAEGTFESRWQFFIREHRLTVELVLLGRAREPDVYATEPVLRLPAVLTGQSVRGERRECSLGGRLESISTLEAVFLQCGG